MATQAATSVTQMWNAKYDQNAKGGPAADKYTYQVDKTVNTTVVRIEEYLSTARVNDLIENGINVTIVGIKK